MGYKMARDFTLEKYNDLCITLLTNNFHILTFSEYLRGGLGTKKFAILRHDIDRKPDNALRMAELENHLGVKSSYYFRYPHTFKVDIIKKIYNLGHEIGYHYEVLSKSNGDYKKAIKLFSDEVNSFNSICKIETICMHGSPLSKFDNRDLWNKYNFEEFGIIGESYLSVHGDINYFSDTGRCWDQRHKIRDFMPSNHAMPTVRNTDDLIDLIEQNIINNLYITAHPERWSSNDIDWLIGHLKDMFFNIGKTMLRGG